MTSWTSTVEAGVQLLEFDRPPRNFMSFVAMGELREHLRATAERDDVRVVVLASRRPGYFVAHADLDDLGRVGRGEPPQGDPLVWFDTLRLIERMPQPVVAAIDGQAWGGGNELALACTLRIASSRAHFAQPEIDLGIIPGSGGTVRLARLVGAGRATELVLTGRVIDAAEALAIGLVQALLPDQDFNAAAVQYAHRLASKPPAALRAAKAATTLTDEDRAGLRREGALFIELQRTRAALDLQEQALRTYRETPPGPVVYLSPQPWSHLSDN